MKINVDKIINEVRNEDEKLEILNEYKKIEPDSGDFIEKMSSALKTIRKKAGLNQKDLAEKMNISQQRVSEIEKLNNGNITLKTLLEYLSYLGQKVSFTFTDRKRKK